MFSRSYHFKFSQIIPIAFSLALLTSCSPKNKNSSINICSRIEIPCESNNQIIEVYTNKGKIVFELYGEYAPVTVGNFLDLVKSGTYEKTIFHRVIREPYPFVINAGDPLSRDLNIPRNKIGLGNFVETATGKVRFIPLEIKLVKEDSPRYGKLIKDIKLISNIQLRHEKGTLSMARSTSLNSASSQFFISLRDLPVLDGRYAVFGKLIKGNNVIDLIKEGDYIEKITHILE